MERANLAVSTDGKSVPRTIRYENIIRKAVNILQNNAKTKKVE